MGRHWSRLDTGGQDPPSSATRRDGSTRCTRGPSPKHLSAAREQKNETAASFPLDRHRLHEGPVGLQLFLPGGKVVGLQQERRDVGRQLHVQAADIVERHRRPDAIGKVADGLAFPAVEEIAAGESRRLIAAAQVALMAVAADGHVLRLAAAGLVLVVHAVPDGARASRRPASAATRSLGS